MVRQRWGKRGVLVWVVAAKMARIEGRDRCRRGGTEVSPFFCVGARESGGETAERVGGSLVRHGLRR